MLEPAIENLKAWRSRYGLSQAALSKLAQIGVNTLMKIEMGGFRVKRENLAKLQRAMQKVEADGAPEGFESSTITPPLQVFIEPVAKKAPESGEPVCSSIESLSYLDLEIIGRIIRMDKRDKLRLLSSLME